MKRMGMLMFGLGIGISPFPASGGVTFTTGNNPQAGEEIVVFADQTSAATVTGYSTTVPTNSLALAATTSGVDQLQVGGDLVQPAGVLSGDHILTLTFTPSSPLDLLIFDTFLGAGEAGGEATYTVQTNLGNVFTFSQTLGASNFLTIDPTDGEALTSLTVSAPGGFDYATAFAAIFLPASVPEPGSWAMMLLGFGAMGIALRRSRRLERRSA